MLILPLSEEKITILTTLFQRTGKLESRCLHTIIFDRNCCYGRLSGQCQTMMDMNLIVGVLIMFMQNWKLALIASRKTILISWE